MKLKLQLIASLTSFADSASVDLLWSGNSLHLIDVASKGITVILFPRNFWRRLETESPMIQATTLHEVGYFVAWKYRTPRDAYTYFIEVPDFLEKS